MASLESIERRLSAIEEKLTKLIEMMAPGPEVDPATGLPYGEVQATCFEVKDGLRTGRRIGWQERVDGFTPAQYASIADSLHEAMTEEELAEYCRRRLAEVTQ